MDNGAENATFIRADAAQYPMKATYRKGDPAFLLEYLATHPPNPELAGLVDRVSKKMRKETKAR